MTNIPTIKEAIEQGRSPIAAFLTNATCGEACWHAREDICRCSCGGNNHGCLKTQAGIKPVRSCKLNGRFYQLAGVTDNYSDALAWANNINKGHQYKIGFGEHYYTYRETDIGAPARVKTASKEQKLKWDELKAYADQPAYRSTYLMWIKQDLGAL